MTKEIQVQASDRSLSIYDPSVMNNMISIADMMGNSNLIPDSLRCEMKDGKVVKEYPIEQIRANCFLIVEQSHRWGLSPFGVAQHASVVRGKLMWEGKLVHSVLSALTGINLSYTYSGKGLDMKITVSGTIDGEDSPRVVSGVVKDWKTSMWGGESNWQQRMAYRGSREWTRRHFPSVMLGVYSDDEELPVKTERNVTPVSTLKPSNPFTIEDDAVEIEDPVEAPVEVEDKSQSYPATIEDVSMSTGNKSNGQPYTLYKVRINNGEATGNASTFSKTLATEAKALKGKVANIKVLGTEKGFQLLSVTPIETEEGIA